MNERGKNMQEIAIAIPSRELGDLFNEATRGMFRSPLSGNYWEVYGEQTCYFIYRRNREVLYGSYNFAISEGVPVYEWNNNIVNSVKKFLERGEVL